MGVGEEALGAHLASEGWSLKPGVLAHFGEREDLASARNALLDTDLRRVGEPIVRAGDAHLAGPVVLQVVAVRDISRPARDSRDPSGAASAFGNGRTKGSGAATRSSARASFTTSRSSRMLRVELTDGDARLIAVEHEPLRFVEDEASIPPGSKVLVPKDVVVRKVNGVLLLRGDDELIPLGGRVASLFRDWERARARRGRDDTSDGNSAGKDAPAYRPYDPGDAAAVEAAAEKRQAEAKRVADEAASAAASAAAAAAAEADRRATADSEAAFVPRRRPALPPTRAQRAAAAASGEALPRPGEPMPVPPPSAEALASDAENEKNETRAPVEARARPALPPRRREAPPAAAPPVPADADARRRERLLSRLVEPSRGGAGGGDRGEGRGGGGGRGERRGGGGRRDGRGGRGRGRDDDDDDDGFVTFEQHVSRRGRGDDDASEALARQLHRELNVDAARDASSDLAASLFAFSRPVADESRRGDRGDRGDRSDRGHRGGRGRR